MSRKTPVAHVILYSRHVSTTMNADARFSSMAPSLQTLSADTDALEVAEAGTGPHGTVTADEREVALDRVHTDLANVRNGVQTLMDNNRAEAASTAAASAMNQRKRTARVKPPLAAKISPSGWCS